MHKFVFIKLINNEAYHKGLNHLYIKTMSVKVNYDLNFFKLNQWRLITQKPTSFKILQKI